MSKLSPPDAAPAPTQPAGTVVTTLVHRATRGQVEWWRRAVVLEFATPFDGPGFTALAREISYVARLGANSIQIHPAVDPGQAREEIAALVRRAHQRGVKVVISLAAHPGEAVAEDHLVGRAAAWLECGVDGLDIGMLPSTLDHPGSAALTSLGQLHALVAEGDAVISAAVSSHDMASVAEHLLEHWMHLTRDDRAAQVPWEAEAVRTTLSAAYAEREAAGAVAAWTLTRLGGAPWGLGDGDEVAARRRRAATLLMMGIPGSIYLRHGEGVGLIPRAESAVGAIEEVAEAVRIQRGEAGSRYERLRRALRLREEFALATGPLAWVGDAPGSSTLALLTRDLLVLTNFSSETIVVPSDRRVLEASDDLPPSSPGEVILPGDTTVWLALT
ncbi:hypothetical protein [Bogoriella caseilytica]|uniref:Alpha-glucosidase n=1 Tax=Bogoriella caseilytica TaxID=56055 RepID=A0A3N2BFR5_9MICO|nr:hypothetical protein [Bogoriella caseilytica]ROR74111.1 hypothetical protein EDD31_2508 [Bogoriella caseilytica]